MTRPRTPRPRPEPAPISTIPPLVVALAMAADPGAQQLPDELPKAYAAARRISTALAAGIDSPEWEEIGALSGIVDHKTDNTDAARAIAILDAESEDLLASIETPIGRAGFWIGFALASYWLTDKGGAR